MRDLGGIIDEVTGLSIKKNNKHVKSSLNLNAPRRRTHHPSVHSVTCWANTHNAIGPFSTLIDYGDTSKRPIRYNGSLRSGPPDCFLVTPINKRSNKTTRPFGLFTFFFFLNKTHNSESRGIEHRFPFAFHHISHRSASSITLVCVCECVSILKWLKDDRNSFVTHRAHDLITSLCSKKV